MRALRRARRASRRQVSLDELDVRRMRQTAGEVNVRLAHNGGRRTLAGRIYPRGISTKAFSTVALDTTGARQMVLVIDDAGDGVNYDNADWAGAVLTLKAGARLVKVSASTRPGHGDRG